MKAPSAVIVDANVVIAGLLRAGDCRHVLLFGSTRFFAPVFLFEEIQDHLPTIIRRSGMPSNLVRALLADIRARIEEVPRASLLVHWDRAIRAAQGTDPDDASYVAAALATGLPIWTLDKRISKVKGIRTVGTGDLVGSA